MRTSGVITVPKNKTKNQFWSEIKIDADRQSCSTEQMQRKQPSREADSPGGEEARRAAPANAEVSLDQQQEAEAAPMPSLTLERLNSHVGASATAKAHV